MTVRDFAEGLLASDSEYLDSELLCAFGEPARVLPVLDVVLQAWDDTDFECPLGVSLVFKIDTDSK